MPWAHIWESPAFKFLKILLEKSWFSFLDSGSIPYLTKSSALIGRLGEFFGAKLHKAIKPMHGKTSNIYHHGKKLFHALPNSFKVCRYHSLVIDINSINDLELSAYTSDNECMGFDHIHLPISGIQFHPEAILTEYGKEILKNWLDITK